MPRPALALACLAAALTLTACGSTPTVPKEQQLGSYSVEPYAEVLEAAVEGGMVDYAAIDERLEQRLDIYLDALRRFGPTETPGVFPTEDDELAYYLNAYNAIMIKLWLNKGARTADVDDKVGWLTWFTVPRWQVDGRGMTLDYLEQRLIRPDYEEARVHAALVCGAVSCPPLRDEPFTGGRLDEQLDDQMSTWLNGPAEDGLYVTDDGKVYFSAILSWYRDDFRETGGLEAVVQKYLDDGDPRKRPTLEALENNDENFMGYDWTINVPENAGPRR